MMSLLLGGRVDEDFHRRVEKQLGFGKCPATAMKSLWTSVRQRLAADERFWANSPVVSGLSMIAWCGGSSVLRVRRGAETG